MERFVVVDVGSLLFKATNSGKGHRGGQNLGAPN
jgi:hypothetical protein